MNEKIKGHQLERGAYVYVRQSEWYVFPFGSPQPTEPTRHVTTLKTVWNSIREKTGVKGRWHDNRHTLITELAESGAGDQTILDIAGHVSKQMLKHYSHIRMEAKRKALEAIVQKQNATTDNSGDQTARPEGSPQWSQNGSRGQINGHATMPEENSSALENAQGQCSESPMIAQHFEGESLQKSLQSCNFEGHRGTGKGRKLLKLSGSSGRTRTYNPSVNRAIINVISTTYAP